MFNLTESNADFLGVFILLFVFFEKGADPQGIYEVKNRLKKILEHAKKISEGISY